MLFSFLKIKSFEAFLFLFFQRKNIKSFYFFLRQIISYIMLFILGLDPLMSICKNKEKLIFGGLFINPHFLGVDESKGQ